MNVCVCFCPSSTTVLSKGQRALSAALAVRHLRMALDLNSLFCWTALSSGFLGFISKPLIETSYKNREIAQETNTICWVFFPQTEAWRLFFQDKNAFWQFFHNTKSEKLGSVWGEKPNRLFCAPSKNNQNQILSRYQSYTNCHGPISVYTC